jgi:hypothetical protein
MSSGSISRIRSASNSSSSVGWIVGIIALTKELVILEDRPRTLIGVGSWQHRFRLVRVLKSLGSFSKLEKRAKYIVQLFFAEPASAICTPGSLCCSFSSGAFEGRMATVGSLVDFRRSFR